MQQQPHNRKTRWFNREESQRQPPILVRVRMTAQTNLKRTTKGKPPAMPFFRSQPHRRVNLAQAAGSLPLTPPPVPGATGSDLLKRYRPLETRATGGFGSVEICLDSRLQRRVAIKRIPLSSEFNRVSAQATASALAEARTASMLQHPNIVQVIDFTYDAAYAYLVMEYIDGMSLEEFLAQVDGNSLTYDEAAVVADALVQALSYAHENGVLHLDIKPANVLIDRSGHVKLADFGMATLTSAAGFGGARGGTIGYMPPEQLNGLEVDERTDIFSLACVLYESLCATAPFRAGTPADSLKNIEKGVLYPSDLLPDIPELAEEALITALSPEPEDRMVSIGDFGDRFLAGLGNTREGRKSLARIIARLTSDEEDPDATADEAPGAKHTWELDPAEGYLGSRTPRARQIAIGALSGIAVAYTAWFLLGGLQLTDPVARTLTSLGIGAAAGFAPQIGSALIGTGFIMLIANATPLIGLLPVAILVFALTASWWFVWGRLQPAASMAFAAVTALACVSGDVVLWAPLVAATAGYFLNPMAAAVSTGFGIVFARLLLAALSGAGYLPTGDAIAALVSVPFWLSALLLSLAAAGVSATLSLTWKRHLDARGTGTIALACAAPFIASILLPALANPMEIASLPPVEIAMGTGCGALSSIIVWICVYSLGYRKDPAEGDRP